MHHNSYQVLKISLSRNIIALGYIFNDVCETLFLVLVLRAQSGCFTHGVRESRACADQFTSRTPCVKQLTALAECFLNEN